MLEKDKLIKGFEKFMDSKSSNFSSFPETIQQSSQMFSSALQDFCANVLPLSISHSLAVTAFISIYTAMDHRIGNGNEILVSSLNSFASVIGTGMIGQSGIVSVVPPLFSTSDFLPVYSIGFSGGSSSDCINLFSDIINTKFKLGIAINISGVSVNWN